jgi:hypothetical protein
MKSVPHPNGVDGMDMDVAKGSVERSSDHLGELAIGVRHDWALTGALQGVIASINNRSCVSIAGG